MAEYDIPNIFSYINRTLTISGGSNPGRKIDYIGHSQGTMIMFAALSDRQPVIQALLGKFAALGPVAFVNHTQVGLLRFLVKH